MRTLPALTAPLCPAHTLTQHSHSVTGTRDSHARPSLSRYEARACGLIRLRYVLPTR